MDRSEGTQASAVILARAKVVIIFSRKTTCLHWCSDCIKSLSRWFSFSTPKFKGSHQGKFSLLYVAVATLLACQHKKLRTLHVHES